MKHEVAFDLSPDHTKCLVYIDGVLHAMLHADVQQPYYTGMKKEDTLFVMCEDCARDEETNEIVISKPLAYITGFNSFAFGPLKLKKEEKDAH